MTNTGSSDPYDATTGSIANGPTVYAGSHWEDDKLYAVDASTGNLLWTNNDGLYTPYSAPTVVDGTLYIGYDGTSSLHAINAATGETEWTFETGDWVRSSPTVVDGTVYFGSFDENLYAVNADTGNQEWKFTQPNNPVMFNGGPAVANGLVHFGTKGSGNLYAVEAETGNKVWEFTGSSGGDPTVYNGRVFLGGDDGVLYAVDAETGREEWTFNDTSRVSTPTVVNNTVYIGTEQSLLALDASTGGIVWESSESSNGYGTPILHSGTLYVGSNNTLRAISANDGTQMWVFTRPNDSVVTPTVHDGTVYFGSRDENLYAVDADTGERAWEFTGADHYMRFTTVVESPSDGDSVGARVNLGTLGHHNVWASRARSSGPNAVITRSTGTLSPGGTVTVDASNSTGQIDTYEWDFGDGTTATGQTVSHSYDTRGTYTVSLTVSNGGSTDTAAAEIVVENSNALNFAIQPSSPAVGQVVSFEASGGSAYEWDFGNGRTATGSQVVHTYDSADSYSVTLTSGTDSVSKDVTVESAGFQIADIKRSAGGVPLENISYQETFTATVTGTETPKQVDFELGDTYKAITDGTDGWSATFDLGTLSETGTLTVTAIAESGETITREQTIQVLPVPEWIEWIVDQGTVTVDEENTRIDVKYAPFDLDSYSFDLGGIPVDADPPSFDGAPKAAVGYDAGQQAAILQGDGDLSTNLFGYGFDASMEVEGAVDQNLDLVSASGKIAASLAIQVGPPLYVDIPSWVPCLSDQLGIETTVAPGLALQGDFNGDFQFQEGTVTPGVDLTVGAQLAICRIGAGAEVTGGLDASFDIGTSDYNLRGTVSGSGRAWIEYMGHITDFSISFEQQLPADSNAPAIEANSEIVGTSLATKEGPRPLPSVPSVDVVEPGRQTSELHETLSPTRTASTAGTYERLTDRSLEDTQPAIATTAGETIVAWSRQHPNKSVGDGRDIAVRRNDGSGWSTLTLVSDDTRADGGPVIAEASGGNLLVAWERVTTDITDDTDPADIHPHVEIAYSDRKSVV